MDATEGQRDRLARRLLFRLGDHSWLKSIATGVAFRRPLRAEPGGQSGRSRLRAWPEPASPQYRDWHAAGLAGLLHGVERTAGDRLSCDQRAASSTASSASPTGWTPARTGSTTISPTCASFSASHRPARRRPRIRRSRSMIGKRATPAYGKAEFRLHFGSHPLVGNFGLRLIDTDADHDGQFAAGYHPGQRQLYLHLLPTESSKNTSTGCPA